MVISLPFTHEAAALQIGAGATQCSCPRPAKPANELSSSSSIYLDHLGHHPVQANFCQRGCRFTPCSGYLVTGGKSALASPSASDPYSSPVAIWSAKIALTLPDSGRLCDLAPASLPALSSPSRNWTVNPYPPSTLSTSEDFPSNGRAELDPRRLVQTDSRNAPTSTPTILPSDSQKNMPAEATTWPQVRPPYHDPMAHPQHPRQPRLNAGTAQILRSPCDLTSAITYNSEYAFAHGGYSDVYLGTLQVKHRGVKGEEVEENISIVIKVIRAYTRERLDFDRARKRLNREVNVLRRLRHPNIAEFLGIAFKQELRPCIVIKCYKNGITPKYIEMNPKVNRLGLVTDIARGLEYLHTLPTPIVHGDLKGCNTLVTDDGHAVITDFGLARIIEEYSAPTGFTTTTLGGSIRWSAPELLFDPDADIDDDSDDEEEDPTPRNPSLKSDIWGFGCVAYELFTGLNPYPDAKYDWNIVKSFTSRNVPSTKRISDGRDRWLKESTEVYRLLRRCWMFTPASRPTIRAITHQLQTAVMAREEGLDT